jgi:hypothetical protein
MPVYTWLLLGAVVSPAANKVNAAFLDLTLTSFFVLCKLGHKSSTRGNSQWVCQNPEQKL